MLAQILPRAAARFGHKTALISAARTLSYAELDALSRHVAGAMAARGIASGDRVSIYAQNCWEWIVAYHGILKAGAVVNPIRCGSSLTCPRRRRERSCDASCVRSTEDESG
jgi:long-chain acyl-CoA synthetase